MSLARTFEGDACKERRNFPIAQNFSVGWTQQRWWNKETFWKVRNLPRDHKACGLVNKRQFPHDPILATETNFTKRDEAGGGSTGNDATGTQPIRQLISAGESVRSAAGNTNNGKGLQAQMVRKFNDIVGPIQNFAGRLRVR